MDTERFKLGERVPDNFVAAHWFVFQATRLVLIDGAVPIAESAEALGFAPVRSQYVGLLDGLAAFSAEILPESALPENAMAGSLRRLFNQLDEVVFWVAARAIQLVDWDRTHQFCGRCATPMVMSDLEHVKICPNCDLHSYPRLSPAVIVAVTKGDRLLLAHNVRHPDGFYTVLAGFVEAGETLEQTVKREIKEEVGINVKNIRYFGSQPWPFPNSLMVGFTAEWADGDFVYEDEIEHADWYLPSEMPPYPTSPSIANALIENFRNNGAA
jgi:NAD+ diphosphatase